jgi:hexokinase
VIKFDIVDGNLTGYASATVDISFDIPVYELLENKTTEGQADTAEEYLDMMRDQLEMYVQSHIECEMDNLGFTCSNEVQIDSCNQSTIHQIEVDVEVEEVEDDDEHEHEA